MPNVIKIDRYNFELYRFKVCTFFLSHSVCSMYALADTGAQLYETFKLA